ncbi:hypothetical protein CC1G_06639 [Coprinopsis cinerea okayama7|uniref:Uncharacterized protein n=1 Tax=Coprinopsis cinerea (strain Okayama-7 / 130 / ATCC MYA-4618 / FGSC 9003) TaxID=240176 RepID=A8P7U3_COPC7|nr:hypothetical protein CC1G_06639 [Coprinopsis cinerea okayama7\|eukprot:XP_001839426.2 hypothetical protein CC1G_06639 [Coprinopsis cinerea okayama7\
MALVLRVFALFLLVAHVRPAFAALAPNETCAPNTIECGGAYKICCASDEMCNINRGIPLCLAGDKWVNQYRHKRCESDVDLFVCDAIEPATSCCPLGTICHWSTPESPIQCVDAMGVTVPAYPTATSIEKPPASAVPITDPAITFSREGAWNETGLSDDLGCSTLSNTLRVTDVIGASVNFTFSGNVIVHTVSHPRGGVFAVFIDGFNTSSIIDTYIGPTSVDPEGPVCRALQFPPFLVLPPGFEHRTEHTISLVYQGYYTENVPDRPSDGHFAQFDAFEVPIFATPEAQASSAPFGSAPSIPVATLLICASGFMFAFL